MAHKYSSPPPKLGRPLAFSEPQELLDWFLDYLSECKEDNKIPSIAGFRANKMIPHSVWYRYVEKEGFRDIKNTILDLIEDIVLNKTDIETTLQTLILKSKHRYADRQEVDIKQENITVSISKST